MKRPSKSTRRDFLKTAAAGSAAALSLPYIIPSSALGEDGTVAPSNRIVMGSIGTGGMGSNDMRTFVGFKDVQLVAVRDVDKDHLSKARDEVNKNYGKKDCKAYGDFRELLGRKDIDAVHIGTPDHWHALVAIAAANANKDIYCQKPLTNSIVEGRAVVEAIKRNNRILQTGNQERSGDNARFACELVRNGRIGKLQTMEVNLPFGTEDHQKKMLTIKDVPPEEPVPNGFDYDFWLGHTPNVPYTPLRCHFNWRWILTYGGGEMTDRGAHVIDLAKLGGDVDETGPVEIEGQGTRSTTSLFNSFTDYKCVNKYANGVVLTISNNVKEKRGVKFIGSNGWIFIEVHGGALSANPASLLKEKIADNEIHLGLSPSLKAPLGHYRNFLDCVKSCQQPIAPAEVGHHTASICHLNNIAMITGRKLVWDPVSEQITNDSDANALLTPSMRAPWHL